MLVATPLDFFIWLSDVDFLPAKFCPTLPAENPAAECIPLLIYTGILHTLLFPPILINLADSRSLLSGNDGLMVIRYQILGQFSPIVFASEWDSIGRIGFLKQQIPFICTVLKNPLYHTVLPFLCSTDRGNPCCFQFCGNGVGSFPSQVFIKNPTHDLRLLFFYNQLSVLIILITIRWAAYNECTFSEPPYYRPLIIGGNALGFSLGDRT